MATGAVSVDVTFCSVLFSIVEEVVLLAVSFEAAVDKVSFLEADALGDTDALTDGTDELTDFEDEFVAAFVLIT